MLPSCANVTAVWGPHRGIVLDSRLLLRPYSGRSQGNHSTPKLRPKRGALHQCRGQGDGIVQVRPHQEDSKSYEPTPCDRQQQPGLRLVPFSRDNSPNRISHQPLAFTPCPRRGIAGGFLLAPVARAAPPRRQCPPPRADPTPGRCTSPNQQAIPQSPSLHPSQQA